MTSILTSMSEITSPLISPLAQLQLRELEEDEKSQIVNTFYGEDAVAKAQKLFFGEYEKDEEKQKEATEWANNWSQELRSKSVFVVFTYVRGNPATAHANNCKIIFKFYIGDPENGSSLGEGYNYKEGIDKLAFLMN